MKILCQQKMIFWAILAVSFIKCESVCFGTDKEYIHMFDNQVLQIEEIWKAGKPNEYFLKAKDIVKDIQANTTTNNLNKVAAKLFDNLISKEVKVGEAGMDGIGDLTVMDKLAWCLVSNDKVSIEERRPNTLLLCRYLGKIRKDIVPNFKPMPVTRNVVPPSGTPRAMAGMSPKAITNPVFRAQYEAAIRENQENGIINRRQQELRGMAGGAIKTRIIGYIIETFHAGDISSAFFIECINCANLNDKEKEEVVSKVGSR